jgi:O-antigen ligase
MMERLAFTCRIAAPPASRDASPPVREEIAASALTPEPSRASYVSLLAFIGVLMFRPQDDIPGLQFLHLADVFGTLALITLLVDRLGRGLAPIRMTPEVGGVLAFAAVMVGTIPLSTWPGGSFAVFNDLFLKIVIILVVMMSTLTSPERIRQVITVLALGAIYVGSRAVMDYARGVNVADGRVSGAIGGLFGNPNDMALNLVTFLPFTIALGLRRDYRVFRLVALGGIPLLVAAIIFSKSRGGTLGLLAMLAVLLYQMRRVRPAIAALVLAAGLSALPLLPMSFTERMATIFDADADQNGSREQRKTLLREGLATFVAHPFTGVGAGQFQNYGTDGQSPMWRQTHNAPLQVAAELGIAGLIIYLYMIWIAFSACQTALRNARALKRARAPDMKDRADWLELNAAMILAGFTGWLVSAMFASVAYYWTLYLLLGLTGSIRDVSERLAAGATFGRRAPWSREAA